MTASRGSKSSIRSFLQPESKVINRNLVVIGALLIQLCLGAIYAWSVFTPYLKDAPFNFSNTQTQAIFSVSLATFAVVMVLAGRWQSQAGPRMVAFVGGLVLGLGYVLGGIFGKTFIGQLLFIGLVGGAGIGLAYVCPIAVGMKWFPDKKGLITGLAVAGFGFGALIWVKLAGSWGGLLASMGVLNVFILYGIMFAVAVVVGSIWMVNPPEGWAPEGWVAPTPAGATKAAAKAAAETAGRAQQEAPDLLPKEMLRTPQFYSIWVMFIFSSMAGLMTIGNIKLFGIDALQGSGFSEAEASAIAGTAMAVFYSLANGIGRIVWGTISDTIGRKLALTVMCALQGVIMLLFYWMGGTPVLLYLGATIIGFNFGGNFSLFPTVTADLFGTKNVGLNYGWVFTAYGVGGIVGPIMAGVFRDTLQSWIAAFIISGIACLIAAVIGQMLKPPEGS
jgi:OFA family oxalate/formate antiporter-like MFS transporter